MRRIPWPEHISNEKVSEKMGTKKYLYLKKIVEISRAQNEERGFRKFNTHESKEQRKTVHDQQNEIL